MRIFRFRSPALILALILLLGFGLRLIRLDFQPLWWDEGYTVWFVAQPLGEMLARTAADIHPPLYYALLHGWSAMFGLSVPALRWFSVMLSLPAMLLAYALGRDLKDRPTGYLAALLVAVNPMAIYYGQEVRMYGLAATLSLAALWTGWRLAGIPREDAKAQRRADWKWGIAYGLSVLAGLYTLYVFILLPAAQFLWMLLARRSRWKAFLASLAGAGLLYLPWLGFAAPKLMNYVPNKVVLDNDAPLPLLAYLARHLSAFTVGHLEGWARGWWLWALLLLAPPLIASAFSLWKTPSIAARSSRWQGQGTGLMYLALVLLVALAGGFIQQVRAPFIPEHFERVLFFAAPALWLLLALGIRTLWLESRPAGVVFLVVLITAQAVSLYAFYTTPRYVERDYRPLIDAVARNLRPGDSVFVIYPWQAGYFLAYLPSQQRPTLLPSDAATTAGRDNTPIILSPDPDWTPAVEHVLQTQLKSGGVWFPEHLSLGGIFEAKVENYLGEHSFQLLNRWFGEETRLTGWDEPRGARHRIELVTPQVWENGVTLLDGWYETTPYRVFFHLNWQGEQAIAPSELSYALWLRGPDAARWAQRDVTPFGDPWPPVSSDASAPWQDSDRIGLTLPAGTPPGDYDLMMALLRPDLSPFSTEGPNTAPDVWLESLSLPTLPPITPMPDHPLRVSGQGVDFLGFDRGDGPWLTGDDIAVTLYWHPRGPLSVAENVFVQLLDDQGRMVAGMEGPPLAWLPTTQWTDVPLRTQHKLRVPATLPPGQYRMIAGMFDPESGARLVWDGEDALSLGEVAIQARAHDFQPPNPQHPLNLTLQGGHKLVGYDLIARTEPGAPVNLILYWQPAGATDIHYSVFVHLIDQEGAILAQDDREPADGEHPTTSWVAGETVADLHAFPFPNTQNPGPFGLSVGLYDPITGRRVPFVDGSGNIIADHIVLPLE